MRKLIVLMALATALLPSGGPLAAPAADQQSAQQLVAQPSPGEGEAAESSQKDVANARWEATRARREFDTLRKEYDGWKAANAKVYETASENERLASEAEALKKEAASLREDKAKLSTHKNIYWFLAGGLVFGIAFLLGHTFGSSKKRGGSGGYRF